MGAKQPPGIQPLDLLALHNQLDVIVHENWECALSPADRSALELPRCCLLRRQFNAPSDRRESLSGSILPRGGRTGFFLRPRTWHCLFHVVHPDVIHFEVVWKLGFGNIAAPGSDFLGELEVFRHLGNPTGLGAPHF